MRGAPIWPTFGGRADIKGYIVDVTKLAVIQVEDFVLAGLLQLRSTVENQLKSIVTGLQTRVGERIETANPPLTAAATGDIQHQPSTTVACTAVWPTPTQ